MSSHHTDETVKSRVPTQRPKYGWHAWEATAGYIAAQHDTNAVLKLEIYPLGEVVAWGATFAWGSHYEAVQDRISIGDALGGLWGQVEQNHVIEFTRMEAAARRPAYFDEDEWLDDASLAMFSRLVGVTAMAFGRDWRIVTIYQPVEAPEVRVQARLVAREGVVQIGGLGATLRDACRSLFHNAAAKHRAFVIRHDEA